LCALHAFAASFRWNHGYIGGAMNERETDAPNGRDAVYYLERAVPWIVFGLVGVIVVLSLFSAVLRAP